MVIPDTEYCSIVTMSSFEFARICKFMNLVSNTIIIETSEKEVKFSMQEDFIGGSVTFKTH